MRIAFGADNAAVALKLELMDFARQLGHETLDCGILTGDANDYPLFAVRVSKSVQQGACQIGVVICGTGIGVSITANKLPGIRCALCGDCYSAKMTRAHNDANMLALGARVIGPELAKMILQIFLETPFEGGRHQHRVDLITRAEKGEPLE